jgi:alkylation response protein AidB-like acyl-CoA dehydrogenase
VLADVSGDLHQFGSRVAGEINDLGRQVELEPPQLEQYDAWGKRVDRLITSPAWKQLHDISAEEGLVEIAYTRMHGPWSRLYQAVKIYMFSPSSGLYSCPLAMTDGAAKVIEGSGHMMLFHRAYSRLTSRDPKEFWTSGQWMTERKGGSDVGMLAKLLVSAVVNKYPVVEVWVQKLLPYLSQTTDTGFLATSGFLQQQILIWLSHLLG